MQQSNIELFLGIWGAGLSTLLGILSFIQFKKESTVNLIVMATAEVPYNQVQLTVVNNGSKPATISNCIISFGSSLFYMTEILKIPVANGAKLEDSDKWTMTFDRDIIRQAFSEKRLKQQPFHRLWVAVELSNGKKKWDSLYINPEIIQSPYYNKAQQFIATDLFLGFEQMESEFYPIGNK